MLVDINLLPQKERDRPAFVIAAISILLLAIIIWAILYFMTQANTNEQAALQAEADQLAVQQAELRAELDATVGMNEEQQLQVTVDWAESYQYDTLPLLDELVSKLPERGYFTDFSYIAPNTANLSVQFDTSRQAAYYLTQIKASELIASIALESVKTQETDVVEEDPEAAGEVEDETIIQNPRYLAVYNIVFVDDRIPAEGTAEAAADGEAIEEAVEEPVEQPKEEVVEETEVPPAETGGDGNE